MTSGKKLRAVGCCVDFVPFVKVAELLCEIKLPKSASDISLEQGLNVSKIQIAGVTRAASLENMDR